jgi:hypothetical protein
LFAYKLHLFLELYLVSDFGVNKLVGLKKGCGEGSFLVVNLESIGEERVLDALRTYL